MSEPHRSPGALTGAPPISRRWLLALLLIALALNSIGLDWGLPAFRSWSPDDITPVGVLRTAYERFTSFPDYPPVHYALLALIYAPYAGYLWLSSGLANPTAHFPYGLTDPLGSLTVFIVLGRLVSVAMGVGIVYLVHQTTKALLDDSRAALFAAAATAFNGHVVLFAHLGNVDVPYLFWLCLAFLGFVRLVRDSTPRAAVALGIGAALSVGTKEVVYSTIAGMALVLTVIWLRERRPFRPLLVGLLAFLGAYALANNVLFAWTGYTARLLSWLGGSGQWLEGGEWQWSGRGDAGLARQATLLTVFASNFINGMGWPMFLATVAGIGVAWRDRRQLLVCTLVPALFYYAGVLPLHRNPLPRFTLPWVILLAPLAGVALARLADADLPRRLGQAVVTCVLAFSFLWAARVDVDLLLDARYDAEAYLRANVPSTSQLEVYGYLMYLPRVQEMGYRLCTITWYVHPPEVFTSTALALRNPDVIVISSLYNNSRHFSPAVTAYFEDLLAGALGYRTTVFRGGGPTWLGWRANPRLNPTIWVLERSGSAHGPRTDFEVRPTSCPRADGS